MCQPESGLWHEDELVAAGPAHAGSLPAVDASVNALLVGGEGQFYLATWPDLEPATGRSPLRLRDSRENVMDARRSGRSGSSAPDGFHGHVRHLVEPHRQENAFGIAQQPSSSDRESAEVRADCRSGDAKHQPMIALSLSRDESLLFRELAYRFGFVWWQLMDLSPGFEQAVHGSDESIERRLN